MTMTHEEYIKKARVLLENFDGWREYDEDAHNEFLEALYQLHLEGVREIIGEMQDVLNEKYIEQIPQYKNITPVEIDIIAEAMREKLKK